MESNLTKEEIIEFLSTDDVNLEARLFQLAREERTKIFGKKIFTYGFIYFSTFCKNNCRFCYYRNANDINRYRKEKEEVVEAAVELANSGVNVIDLTAGEDIALIESLYVDVIQAVQEIKKQTNLPVMISLGVLENDMIDKFILAGADWYALYQETHNRELFKKLRVDQSYAKRMDQKIYAKNKGMLIEEGILVGVGETIPDIAESILQMKKIGAHQVRVMSFIPQKGSPMEDIETPNRKLELRIIALMRLVCPRALIPASLDVDGIEGLDSRIEAGANVVTSIIPPDSGLMGVAQSKKDVEEGGRTVNEVKRILGERDYILASNQEYQEYINELRMNKW